MRRYPLIASVVLLALPLAAAAQSPARLAFIDDWKHQQKHTLAVLDSATPEMLGFRPTKGVRNFAEQIDHIAGSAAMIVAMGVAAKPLPKDVAGDTAVYLHDKAKLRAQTEKFYDFVIRSLSDMSDEQLVADQRLMGGSMPKWRWNLTALQHSAWTLGQTVPYLRLNGRTPPMFTPF